MISMQLTKARNNLSSSEAVLQEHHQSAEVTLTSIFNELGINTFFVLDKIHLTAPSMNRNTPINSKFNNTTAHHQRATGHMAWLNHIKPLQPHRITAFVAGHSVNAKRDRIIFNV